MAPPPEPKEETMYVSSSKARSLRAGNFHTLAFKISLEINIDNITNPTKRSFLKVLYTVRKVKKKNLNFEQYARIHFDGPKMAICKTVSETIFVLNSPFTSNDNYFRVAIDYACDAFNEIMLVFGYTQQLEIYNPNTH